MATAWYMIYQAIMYFQIATDEVHLLSASLYKLEVEQWDDPGISFGGTLIHNIIVVREGEL